MNEFTFVCDRISMFFLLVFLVSFLPLRFSVKKSIGIAAVVFAITAPIEQVQCHLMTGSRITVELTLLDSLIVQLTAFFLCRYRDFRALFVGVTAAAYVMVGNLAGMVLFVQTGQLWGAIAVQTALHVMTYAVLFRWLRQDFLSETVQRKYWGWFCLIPVLLYCIEYSLSVWPQNVYDKPENVLPILLVLIMMVAAYTLVFSLIARLRKDYDYRHDIDCLTTSVSSLKHEIESAQENQLALSILKHDMRHDNNVLLAYLEQGRLDELREQLVQMNGKLEQIVTAQYCRNIAVNSVLQANAAKAVRVQVDFRCEAQVPEKLPMGEFELAAVVSNLAENAVRAAAAAPAGKRWVQVRIHPVKSQLLVSVTNPYAGTLKFDRHTGLPRSDRGEGHGYGLRSVRFFAEKCGAVFDCTTDDNMFSVRMLIPIEKDTN